MCAWLRWRIETKVPLAGAADGYSRREGYARVVSVYERPCAREHCKIIRVVVTLELVEGLLSEGQEMLYR